MLLACRWWIICLGFIASFAVQSMADEDGEALRLVLKNEVTVHSNVLRLRDVCDVDQSGEWAKSVQDVPLAPTPRAGIVQSWTREDLAKFLTLRGIEPASVRWEGSEVVRVLRDQLDSPQQDVVPASAIRTAPSPARGTSSDGASLDEASSRDFAPAFVTPVTLSQAERVVASVLESYLHLKTGAQGKWTIKPTIPPKHASDLAQRRQIVSVAGGEAPWEGHQRFSLLMRTSAGESVIDVEADVRLPMMVVAAKGPLAKGRILQESDLVWLALPPNSKMNPEECFTDFESLLGKQLRKSVSTQQPFRLAEVGAPHAVQTGDSVTIAVLAGSVRVEAYGRAIESGAIDDMIQVEVLPQRKRVAARVVSDRRVEIIAGGPGPIVR